MEDLRLVVIGGLPLHGKTTLGKTLERATGIHLTDIDHLRREAFGFPTREEYESRWADQEAGAKWTAGRMGMAYRLLHEGAVDIALGTGQSLIVASTYSRAKSQEFVKGFAEKHGVVVKPIICRILDETREEIERRMARDVDEEYIHGCATWNDYLDITERFEALDTAGVFPSKNVLVVDTTTPVTGKAFDRVVEFINS